MHGHITEIAESHHHGHHRIEIKHGHLKKKGGKDEPFAYEPRSTVHLPHGHGLEVGHAVHVHVTPAGSAED